MFSISGRRGGQTDGKLRKTLEVFDGIGLELGYTPITALNYVIARLFYLMDWFAPMIVVLFMVSLFSKKEDSSLQRLFRYGLLYIAGAYFFYFS